jgi:hypothetical protein
MSLCCIILAVVSVLLDSWPLLFIIHVCSTVLWHLCMGLLCQCDEPELKLSRFSLIMLYHAWPSALQTSFSLLRFRVSCPCCSSCSDEMLFFCFIKMTRYVWCACSRYSPVPVNIFNKNGLSISTFSTWEVCYLHSKLRLGGLTMILEVLNETWRNSWRK